MKAKLTQEYIMNYWLEKGHGITVQWLIENESKLIKSPDWYKKYAVSQELHDEWYEWAISELAKNLRASKKSVKRWFAFDYLNCSPSIKK
jgi:hypothetical protein